MVTYPIVLRDADEIEHFFVATTGMKPGYLQLSRGLADLRLRVVELNEVTLVWCRARGKARWRDQMTGDNLHVGFAVESAGPITACGREIQADDGQVWMPDKEMDLVLDGPNLTLEVAVDRSLVDELGWQVTGDPLSKVPPKALRRLVNTCIRITDSVRSLPDGAIDSMVELNAKRNVVLDALEPVLQPWLVRADESATLDYRDLPHYELVRRADEYFDACGLHTALDVDRLIAQLGAPRRTVFHAFRKLLGVGPRTYLEIRRLHALRAALREASYADATVTDIATGLGFGDLGRMARKYQLHFDERPSETLRYG